MAGGAPAGMKIVPGEEGCTTTSINISIITMHGNTSTKPKGIDIFELPFSRIRRLKNAERDGRKSFSRGRSSSEGGSGAEGRCFMTRCTNPMIVVDLEVCAQRSRQGPAWLAKSRSRP